MNDPDPGQSTTSAVADDAPGATDACLCVLINDGIADTSDMRALTGVMREAARAAMEAARGWPAQATIAIATDAQMRALNLQFRGIDKPTNVLSFPEPPDPPHPAAPGEARFLGDVVVSLDTLAREAAEQGKSLSAHAAHLVIHGVLHLLGHTHDADGAAARMEALEVQALESLGLPDPYAETELIES